MRAIVLAFALFAAFATSALAAPAEILSVRAIPVGSDKWDFEVEVRHPDEGWDHYADGWDVLTPDGQVVLGTRTLYHPHVEEQPFTRALSGVAVPRDIDEVILRAHCSLDGYAGTQAVTVPLDR